MASNGLGGSDGRIRLQCGRPGFNPWVGKMPWEGNGYSFQYSYLENSTDKEPLGQQSMVSQSRTQLRDYHTYMRTQGSSSLNFIDCCELMFDLRYLPVKNCPQRLHWVYHSINCLKVYKTNTQIYSTALALGLRFFHMNYWKPSSFCPWSYSQLVIHNVFRMVFKCKSCHFTNLLRSLQHPLKELSLTCLDESGGAWA